MRTDGQTDMTRLIVVFRNFAEVSKFEPLCALNPCDIVLKQNGYQQRVCGSVFPSLVHVMNVNITYTKR